MISVSAYYLLLNQEPNVNLTVDGNTLLWAALSGMVIIISFFIARYINSTDKALHELEVKVDKGFEQVDKRLDSFELSQVRIMVKLGIDE